jgi:hypothetical protein
MVNHQLILYKHIAPTYQLTNRQLPKTPTLQHQTGSVLYYTGEGGQKGKKQVADQEWKGGNLALQNNMKSGEPVRVIRGKVRGEPAGRRLGGWCSRRLEAASLAIYELEGTHLLLSHSLPPTPTPTPPPHPHLHQAHHITNHHQTHQVGPKNERIYVYEGLYKVVEAKMQKSSDGPLVCK